MLQTAILHSCQNYLGGGGGLGGSEKNIFLAPYPPPLPLPTRAIIPDAGPLGTFKNQDTSDGKTRMSKRSHEKIGDCEHSKKGGSPVLDNSSHRRGSNEHIIIK